MQKNEKPRVSRVFQREVLHQFQHKNVKIEYYDFIKKQKQMYTIELQCIKTVFIVCKNHSTW